MEIVGYNREDEFTGKLKEATITCNIDELKTIADFLNNIIDNHDETPVCVHLRDYKKDWDKHSSDLIVLIPSQDS